VRALLNVTVAPGITDFCASVTSPMSEAVPVCADATKDDATSSIAASA
jgi:hypothetical protein